MVRERFYYVLENLRLAKWVFFRYFCEQMRYLFDLCSFVELFTEMLEFIQFHLVNGINRLNKNEKGVTTVEYAVMLVLVAIAVAVASPNIRSAVISVFNAVSSALVVAAS